MTWQSERPEGAQFLWNDALAEAGIRPRKPRRVDAGLDDPQAIDRLLRAAGFMPERSWSETLRRRWDRGSFWALLTGMGANPRRLGLIDGEARPDLLAHLREQLDRLGPEDFLCEGTAVCSAGVKRDPTLR